jgi:two-component system phosphate regulon sensor histidine kinase PhoR
MASNVKTLVENITAEEIRLATVLTNMTDGVIMTDRESKIILANHAATTPFGFDEEKATTLSLIEATHDHEADEILKACLKTGVIQTGQVETVNARRFLHVVAIPVTDEKISGALLLFQDLTEVRSIQTMRRELIANISHDFRTPIAGIKAMVETLQDGAIKDKKAAPAFLIRIDGEVDRLNQMVTELTELSHFETGTTGLKKKPTDINLLVTDVAKQMAPIAEKQHMALKTELTPVPAVVSIDKDRIRQTIVNLVHNAIKFNRRVGAVTVAVVITPKLLTISVKDTGIGISQADLPHVYERFYKADRARGGGSGSGIGDC